MEAFAVQIYFDFISSIFFMRLFIHTKNNHITIALSTWSVYKPINRKEVSFLSICYIKFGFIFISCTCMLYGVHEIDEEKQVLYNLSSLTATKNNTADLFLRE